MCEISDFIQPFIKFLLTCVSVDLCFIDTNLYLKDYAKKVFLHLVVNNSQWLFLYRAAGYEKQLLTALLAVNDLGW